MRGASHLVASENWQRTVTVLEPPGARAATLAAVIWSKIAPLRVCSTTAAADSNVR